MEDFLRVAEDVELKYRVDRVVRAKAVVIINHGFAEHIGRYDHVARYLNDRGFTCYRYDLRGHGNSESEKGYIDSYENFITDCHSIVKLARRENPGQDIFMLGHSMGGLVTCMYGIVYPDSLKGQIFSGPAANSLPAASGLAGLGLRFMGSFFPRKMMRNVVEDDICSLEEVVEDYKNDPDVLREASFKFLKEFLIKGPKFVREFIHLYKYPCLICHGGEDKIVPPDVGRYLYDNISSEDKEFKLYPGLYHEILNEEEGDEILDYMIDWMEERLEE